MRAKFLFLLITQVSLSLGTVHATDLRGGVAGFNPYTHMTGGLPGVPIGLFTGTPGGGFIVVRQTVTGPDGLYYLAGVYPGQYVLQIAGVNYPLMVGYGPMQDIPVVYR